MTLKESLEKLYEKLNKPELSKKCIILAMLIFFPGLIIAIIIAHYFGPPAYIPPLHKILMGSSYKLGRYSLWQNWISDLGSFRFTPAPFILDLMLMSAGVLMIPVFFYLYTKFISASSSKTFFDAGTKSGDFYVKLTTFWLRNSIFSQF